MSDVHESDLPLPTPQPIKRPLWFRVHPLLVGGVGLAAGFVLGVGIFGAGVGISNALSNSREAAEQASDAAARADAQAARRGILAAAVESCGLNPVSAQIGDGGFSLDLEGRGKDDLSGVSSAGLWCFVDAMKTPSSVVSHMEQTTSLDGRQAEEFDGIEVSWSYHPDRGMDSVWVVQETG
jgi:hypothetical protein